MMDDFFFFSTIQGPGARQLPDEARDRLPMALPTGLMWEIPARSWGVMDGEHFVVLNSFTRTIDGAVLLYHKVQFVDGGKLATIRDFQVDGWLDSIPRTLKDGVGAMARRKNGASALSTRAVVAAIVAAILWNAHPPTLDDAVNIETEDEKIDRLVELGGALYDHALDVDDDDGRTGAMENDGDDGET